MNKIEIIRSIIEEDFNSDVVEYLIEVLKSGQPAFHEIVGELLAGVQDRSTWKKTSALIAFNEVYQKIAKFKRTDYFISYPDLISDLNNLNLEQYSSTYQTTITFAVSLLRLGLMREKLVKLGFMDDSLEELMPFHQAVFYKTYSNEDEIKEYVHLNRANNSDYLSTLSKSNIVTARCLLECFPHLFKEAPLEVWKVLLLNATYFVQQGRLDASNRKEAMRCSYSPKTTPPMLEWMSTSPLLLGEGQKKLVNIAVEELKNTSRIELIKNLLAPLSKDYWDELCRNPEIQTEAAQLPKHHYLRRCLDQTLNSTQLDLRSSAESVKSYEAPIRMKEGDGDDEIFTMEFDL